MTRKKRINQLARKIRKATGLTLPVSIVLAKARDNYTLGNLLCMAKGVEAPTRAAARAAVKSRLLCECCGYETYIEGPKGRIMDYDI